mgnify:CR=1 FL=1
MVTGVGVESGGWEAARRILACGCTCARTGESLTSRISSAPLVLDRTGKAVVAAANAAAATGPSSMSGDPSGTGSAAAAAMSGPGGGGGAGAGASGSGMTGPNGPLLGPMRSDVLSSSVASMEQLRDTPDASSVGPSGEGMRTSRVLLAVFPEGEGPEKGVWAGAR